MVPISLDRPASPSRRGRSVSPPRTKSPTERAGSLSAGLDWSRSLRRSIRMDIRHLSRWPARCCHRPTGTDEGSEQHTKTSDVTHERV